MADNESLPGLNIPISADYSAAKEAFGELQGVAQTAGTSVASAFNTAASGVQAFDSQIEKTSSDVNQLGDALANAGASTNAFTQGAQAVITAQATADAKMQEAAATLTELQYAYQLGAVSAETLARAEENLATATDKANPGIKETGDAATATDSSLAGMAHQLAAVAEALVITEGMRAFGQEALSAADSVMHANIALTTITGSAEQAKTVLEELDQLGQTDGLSMPSLRTAATRMENILGPSVDVNKELRLIADGAAVMGTDIETAGTKFDILATAGTASARTLTGLGISLSSLATAFNHVIAGSDETAASVAKSFKALDQSQRIDVLNAALETLGGTAEKVANQTFGGQWQQLANQWEGIMVQAGQALLPVISGITEFTKTDIIPFLQILIDDFKSLSPPMQQAAVAVTLAVAAIVPLTGALAAAGLAVSGLSGLLPALDALLGTLGVTAAATAIQEDAATAATVALGEAAQISSVEIAAAEGAAASAGAVIAGSLAAALVGGAALWADWKLRLDGAHASLTGISDSDFNDWLKRATDGLKTASISTADLEAESGKLKTALDFGAISAKQYAVAMDAITAAEKRIAAENLADSVAKWTSGLTILKDGATKATDSLSLLKVVLDETTAAQAKVNVEYQAGKRPAEDLISANKSLAAAQKQYSDALAATKPDPVIDGLRKLATQADITAAGEDVLANKFKLLEEAVVVAAQRLVDLDTEAKALDKTTAAGITTNQVYLNALQNVASANDDYKAKVKALNQAKLDAKPIDDVQLDDAKRLGIQMNITGESVATTTNKLGEFGVILTTTVIPAEESTGVATDLVTQALKRQADEAVAATADIDALTAGYQSMTDVLNEAATAFQNVGASQDIKLKGQTGYTMQVSNTPGGGFSIQEVPLPATALKLAEQAARENADQSSNPKGLSDPTTLARQALAEAQALLPIIQAAFTAGNVGLKASDAQSAQSAVASAQSALDKLLGGTAPTSSPSADASTSAGGNTTVVSGPSDTAASGGSYPGVVIHQAPGEVLLVSGTSAQASFSAASGGASTGGGDTNSLIASVAATTANAITTAASTMALVVSNIDALAGSLQQTSAANAAAAYAAYSAARVATGVGTTVVGGNPLATNTTPSTATSTTGQPGYANSIGGTPPPESVTSNYPSTSQTPAANPGSSYIAYPGVPAGGNYIPPSAPQAAGAYDSTGRATTGVYYTPPTPSAGGGGPGGLQTASINITFGDIGPGADPAKIKAMLMDVVPNIVTRAVRDAGARI